MCGITGFYNLNSTKCEREEVLYKMSNAIFSRGPDDNGMWIDDSVGLGLAHRRLSIMDTSSAGHQPMTSPSGRFVIVFNGEIYNHLDIRNILQITKGIVAWKGTSDTETILAAIDAWGLKNTLKQVDGMFALALWDRQERELFLARDRMGEKPLYYGWQSNTFLFGSELKAIRSHIDFNGTIDRNAIMLQLRYSYIPAPYSIYKDIKKLLPGTFIRLVMDGSSNGIDKVPEPEAYWNLHDVIQEGKKNPFIGDDSDAVNVLDSVLSSAVKKQMLADVPLGAFLSGGIDSSAVVALMQSQSSKPVKTFSIGFNETGFNEAVYAKAVANHLGTDHTELYVTSEQAMNVIPKLPVLYDEPFSDSSQIPTFLVSEMSRQHVSVALSGDAGDELFGGYNRYFKTHQWWNKIQSIPTCIRFPISSGLESISPIFWDRFGDFIASLSNNSERWYNMGRKVSKLAGVLNVNDDWSLYKYFVSHWNKPESIVIGGGYESTQVNNPSIQLSSLVEQMMAIDSLSYLPDDILVKVDRAAMGVSLETRVPFLDSNVVEFAWKLPLSMKIRHGQGKWILRQLLYQYVPKELIERPKMGFGVPIDSWLRGPLRDWAENLLDESRLRQEGYFYPQPIRKKWKEHLSGKRNWQHHLWDVLMFQAWLEAQP